MISSVALLLGGCVVATVGTVELWLLLQASQCVRTDYEKDLEELEEQLRRDLEQRAERGQVPDWIRYRAELDRLFEPLDERLRSLSSAALSAGLGGTILALIAHALVFLIIDGEFNTDPRQVIVGIGIGLFGSLAGVVCNLAIILGFLPQLEKRFVAASRPVIARLQEASDRHPATEAFVLTLKKEMEELRETLRGEVGEAFKQAIGQFPEILGQLRAQLASLAEVAENQGKNVEVMVTNVDNSSKLLKESSELLEPTIRPLAQVSQQLVALPRELSKVLTLQQQLWIDDLNHRHQERWDQLNNLVEVSKKHEGSVRVEVGEIRAAVEAIPKQLGDAVRGAADRFGDRFGLQAREHLNDYKSFLTEHEAKWRNKLGEVLPDLLKAAKEPIEANLIPRLEGVAETLEKNTQALADAGKDAASYHQAWKKTQEEALGSWIETSEKIESANRSLGDSEHQLRRTASILEGSAGDLERVAKVEEAFERNLRESLERVTSDYLGEVRGVLDELEQRRKKYDAILDNQSKLIVDLIGRAVERYPAPPSQGLEH